MRWMDYKIKIGCWLLLMALTCSKLSAQPGCGQLYIHTSQLAEPLSDIRMKSCYLLFGERRLKRLPKYAIRGYETFYLLDHYSGMQVIKIRSGGKRMKLILEDISCDQHYFIDGLRLEEGTFKIVIDESNLIRIRDKEDHKYPCGYCLWIPFSDFVKE